MVFLLWGLGILVCCALSVWLSHSNAKKMMENVSTHMLIDQGSYTMKSSIYRCERCGMVLFMYGGVLSKNIIVVEDGTAVDYIEPCPKKFNATRLA